MMNENNDELIKFKEIEKNIIFPFLANEFTHIDSANILYQGIDQYVEIYGYLINKKYVIEFDLSTIDHSISKNEILTVEDYEASLRGKGRAKRDAREFLRQLMRS
ncbi:hypothetical protein [Providencia stuartii]|uniref:hypothetical protein n=1 Tax=Providencia stuartii TaxID=588 RepID=UPI0018C5EA2C|nr:hypothetical protein [Providencia stuartii]MBG5918803.1 hypothetical protein [Providencia stuartii]